MCTLSRVLHSAAAMAHFKFSYRSSCFTVLGLAGLLVDIVLDVLTVVDFYRDRDYIRMGLLILFLVVSSLLVQAYSWLWYKYEDFDRVTKVENVPITWLKILHFLQLGTYLRHLGVIEMVICKYRAAKGMCPDPGDVAVYLSHDVAMLRILETFSESLPQLVLMLTTNIQRGHLDFFPVLKAAAAVFTVSFTVMSYHRSLRSFLKDKHQQTPVSSVVYLLWNFLLIAARVSALALFASEWPCYIGVHFLCSWTLLFICAWCCQTDFMDSKGGEVLYRATVALIWYFNWFNVVEGNTLQSAVLYHGCVLADIVLLLWLWVWKMNPDLTNINREHFLVFCILLVYIMGVLFRYIYHHFFHPNVTKKDLKSEDEKEATRLKSIGRVQDEVDSDLEFIGIDLPTEEEDVVALELIGVELPTEEEADPEFIAAWPPRKEAVGLPPEFEAAGPPRKEAVDLGPKFRGAGPPRKEAVGLGPKFRGAGPPRKEAVGLGPEFEAAGPPTEEAVDLGPNFRGAGPPRKEAVGLGPKFRGAGPPRKEAVGLGPEFRGTGPLRKEAVGLGPEFRGAGPPTEEEDAPKQGKKINKRMRNLAENFYF